MTFSVRSVCTELVRMTFTDSTLWTWTSLQQSLKLQLDSPWRPQTFPWTFFFSELVPVLFSALLLVQSDVWFYVMRFVHSVNLPYALWWLGEVQGDPCDPECRNQPAVEMDVWCFMINIFVSDSVLDLQYFQEISLNISVNKNAMSLCYLGLEVCFEN